MSFNKQQNMLLRSLPAVDHIQELLKQDSYYKQIPKSVSLMTIRDVIKNLRTEILAGGQNISEACLCNEQILKNIKAGVRQKMTLNLKRVVNATGVVVHTNLGRSLIAGSVAENISNVATSYSNLEFDLSKRARGSRYNVAENILCEITRAEAAMVVNNNAGAVLLCLDTIASGRKVIVSRGELVEIGGSFRIPDVMAKSGCVLTEVGTTNRTHVHDYENAMDMDTGLLLRVHTSNYSIVGFTAQVPLNALTLLGKKYQVPVMEDLGSGTFIDFSKYGLAKEPTVQESVDAGVDVITFSGDKLLGGPQAGIITGKKHIIDKIKKNPLTRALRIDKMTLAALESTLHLYRDEQRAINTIPTLRMLTIPLDELEKKAHRFVKMAENTANPCLQIQIVNCLSKAGGGSLPLLELPGKCIAISIRGLSANDIEKNMRNHTCPVIGRIEKDLFILDLRTVSEDEFSVIITALQNMLK
jgi:L-seryl-tRNA(Ser) seleniumtransferase